MVNNRPLLRFNGFQEPWEIKKLGEVFDITRGYVLATNNVSSSANFNNIYPVYSSQTLNSGLLGYYNEYLYENAITWTTDGANAGTVNFRGGKFYCTNVCGVLLPKIEIPNKMIALAINLIAKRYVSYVGNPKLMNTTMAEITLPLPSFPEQTKIGNLFSNIDILIENEENRYKKLLDIKKSLLNNMFPLENTYIPSIRFNGYSEKWEVKRLGDITNKFNNLRVPVSEIQRIAGYIPYYGATGIQDYVEGFTHEGEFVLIAEDGASNLNDYPVKYVKGKIWVNNHAHVINGNYNFVNNYFLSILLKNINYYKYIVGSSRYKLNSNVLDEINILIPQISEQTKLGKLFNLLDNLANLYTTKISKLKTIKQSLLNVIFI